MGNGVSHFDVFVNCVWDEGGRRGGRRDDAEVLAAATKWQDYKIVETVAEEMGGGRGE